MIIKVKIILRSSSFQGQGHFEVFQESNCKCVDFYPKAGSWLSSECFLVFICCYLLYKHLFRTILVTTKHRCFYIPHKYETGPNELVRSTAYYTEIGCNIYHHNHHITYFLVSVSHGDQDLPAGLRVTESYISYIWVRQYKVEILLCSTSLLIQRTDSY